MIKDWLMGEYVKRKGAPRLRELRGDVRQRLLAFLGDVVGEAARVTTVTSASLEGIACATLAGAAIVSRNVSDLVEEATPLSSVTLASLEGEAHSRSFAGSTTNVSNVAVSMGELACVATVALTSLKGKALG